jgi:predicted small lipoprotein YifL
MQGSALVKGDLATHLRRVAVLMLVVGAVAGCGRKGALEPSPSATKSGAEGEAKPAQQQGGIASLRGKKPPPVTPSKTPSVLDWILE